MKKRWIEGRVPRQGQQIVPVWPTILSWLVALAGCYLAWDPPNGSDEVAGWALLLAGMVMATVFQRAPVSARSKQVATAVVFLVAMLSLGSFLPALAAHRAAWLLAVVFVAGAIVLLDVLFRRLFSRLKRS